MFANLTRSRCAVLESPQCAGSKERLPRNPTCCIVASMKHLQLIGLIACAAFFVSCESTEMAGPGQGNQETKRLAALQQEKQESAQMDEADQNLWAAQQARLNRDSNPAIRP